MDESYSDKVFCLAGVIINEREFNNITAEFNKLKSRFGLKKSDFIKFSLGSSGLDKTIKEKIKKSLKNKTKWLTYFRTATINKISDLNLNVIASLHQDVRRSSSKKKHIPVDFYLTAFEFLLQRIWWITKDKISPINIIIIVDDPPGKNIRTKICSLYKKVFYKGFSFPKSDSDIPPLINYNFFESPLISKSDYNKFIQISDFCAGAIKERGKDLLKSNRERASKNFMKILIQKIYGYNEENIIGKGLVIFPRDRELYELMQKDVKNIISENKKNQDPF